MTKRLTIDIDLGEIPLCSLGDAVRQILDAVQCKVDINKATLHIDTATEDVTTEAFAWGR